jgi:hypothetical protein
MHLYRQTSKETAREVIVSFMDLSPADRAAKLANLSQDAQTRHSANSLRGKALIAFWQTASMAVALDCEHQSGDYKVTSEAHSHMREAAIVAAGDAIFSYVVSVIPISVAVLLSGELAPA